MSFRIFERCYKPKSFCREYADVKGDSIQLGMFMSTVLGIKPLMDDWIPVQKVSAFKAVCKSYGLKVREDVIFLNIPKNALPPDIVGKENLTSTSAYGFPLKSRTDGYVHIFISRNEKMLPQGMWYPVIIKGRVIFQPVADTLKYGSPLGYPSCCIRFFRKFNDWSKYSYLYEAYIRSKAQSSFLCNPFLKDTPFSYIYHMPCGYACAETIRLALKLRKEIKKREPAYAALTDQYLQLPFFVFYEKKIYCFEGTLKNHEIKYRNFYFSSFDRSEDMYSVDFEKADTLRLEGRRILLLRRNKIYKKMNITLKKFAPEYPFLTQFAK